MENIIKPAIASYLVMVILFAAYVGIGTLAGGVGGVTLGVVLFFIFGIPALITLGIGLIVGLVEWGFYS